MTAVIQLEDASTAEQRANPQILIRRAALLDKNLYCSVGLTRLKLHDLDYPIKAKNKELIILDPKGQDSPGSNPVKMHLTLTSNRKDEFPN